MDLESLKRVLLELKGEAKRMRKDELGPRYGKDKPGMDDKAGMLKEAVMGAGPEDEEETAEVEMPSDGDTGNGSGPGQLEESSEETDPGKAPADGEAMDEAPMSEMQVLFKRLGIRR